MPVDEVDSEIVARLVGDRPIEIPDHVAERRRVYPIELYYLLSGRLQQVLDRARGRAIALRFLPHPRGSGAPRSSSARVDRSLTLEADGGRMRSRGRTHARERRRKPC
jgi:hypothetical protein